MSGFASTGDRRTILAWDALGGIGLLAAAGAWWAGARLVAAFAACVVVASFVGFVVTLRRMLFRLGERPRSELPPPPAALPIAAMPAPEQRRAFRSAAIFLIGLLATPMSLLGVLVVATGDQSVFAVAPLWLASAGFLIGGILAARGLPTVVLEEGVLAIGARRLPLHDDLVIDLDASVLACIGAVVGGPRVTVRSQDASLSFSPSLFWRGAKSDWAGERLCRALAARAAGGTAVAWLEGVQIGHRDPAAIEPEGRTPRTHPVVAIAFGTLGLLLFSICALGAYVVLFPGR